MKLKSIIGSILVLAGQSTYACDESKAKDTRLTGEKKPSIAVSGDFLKTLSPVLRHPCHNPPVPQ